MPDPTELWTHYHLTRSPEDRDRLILEFLPLAHMVAVSFSQRLPRHILTEDLAGYAVFGLIDAIEHFDPALADFERYARPIIRHRIVDELRRVDLLSRPGQARVLRVARAHDDLRRQLQREPRPEEIASYAGIGLDEMARAISDSADQVPLTATLQDSHPSPGWPAEEDVRGDGEGLHELRGRVATAIRELPVRERIVFTLYYREGMTLQAIGAQFGLSAATVSSVKSDALGRIQQTLGI